MATKCFLRRQSETTPTVTPDSGWEDTSSIVRCWLRTATSSDSHADVTITETSSTDKDCLARQYIAPLKAGQTVTGSQAVQFVARFQESTSSNNMHSVFGIRVVNVDTTVKKTVLAVTREANEFVASPTTPTNRNNTQTSAATNYTTVDGDMLVVEIGAGGDPTSSNPHTYTINLGDNTGTFLTANDTDTSANDPWVQLADTLVLEWSVTTPSVSLSTIFSQTTSHTIFPGSLSGANDPTGIFAPSVAVAVPAAELNPLQGQLWDKAPDKLLGSRIITVPFQILVTPLVTDSTIFEPSVAYELNAPGPIGATSIFIPSVAYELNPPGPITGTSIHQQTVAMELDPPAVSQSTIFAPSLVGDQTLDLPATSLSQIFSQTVADAGGAVAVPKVYRTFFDRKAEPEPSYNIGVLDDGPILEPPAIALSQIFTPSVGGEFTLLPPAVSLSNVFTPTVALAAGPPEINVVQGALWDKPKDILLGSRTFLPRQVVAPGELQPPSLALSLIFEPSLGNADIPKIFRTGFLRQPPEPEPSQFWQVLDDGVVIDLPAVSLSQIFAQTTSQTVIITVTLGPATIFAPTLPGAQTLDLPAVSLSVIFAPVAAEVLEPSTATLSTIFAPSVSVGLLLPFVSLSQIYTPTLTGVGTSSGTVNMRFIGIHQIGLRLS